MPVGVSEPVKWHNTIQKVSERDSFSAAMIVAMTDSDFAAAGLAMGNDYALGKRTRLEFVMTDGPGGKADIIMKTEWEFISLYADERGEPEGSRNRTAAA